MRYGYGMSQSYRATSSVNVVHVCERQAAIVFDFVVMAFVHLQQPVHHRNTYSLQECIQWLGLVISSLVLSTKLFCAGPVSTRMGDHTWVQRQVQENLCRSNQPPDQLSLAIPP